MKKLLILLSFLISLSALSQTPIPFSSLTLYTGNLDSVKYVGLLKSGNAYTNRLFYGIDLVKNRVKYDDSSFLYITPTSLNSSLNNSLLSYYTKSQADTRYLQSFTETDPVWSAASGNYYTKIQSDAAYAGINHTHSFTSLTSKPTTIAGYGITDAFTQAAADGFYSPLGHTHAFSSLTSIPTTVSGYGITDVYTRTQSDARYLQTYSETDPVFTGSYVHGITSLGSGLQLSLGVLSSTITQYTDALARAALNVNGGATGQVLKKNSNTDYDYSWQADNTSSGGMTNPMSTVGAMIYGGTSGTPTNLSGNTTSTRKFLSQTGDGTNSAAPGWNTIAATDVPTLNQNTTGTADHVSGTNVITNTNLAQMAAGTIKGNNTAGTANAADLTTAQLKTLLAISESDVASLTPDLASKQAQLNGTGFVKASGTSISYDNTTYATVNQTTVNGLVKGNGTILSVATSGVDYSAGTSGLATGILKNTTTTGALSIALAGDFPTLNQNTTGTADHVSGTNVITNTNLSQMAANTLKGNNTGVTANAVDLTASQVKTLLAIAEGDVTNLTPDLAAKQTQLNGTGFVKASGTTISYDNTSYASLAGATYTGNITTMAGTTIVAPLVFTSGANLSTATAGSWEYDGKTAYFTASSTSRGVVPSYQFASVPSGTVALSSATGLQAVFASANDVVNLAANTTYRFNAVYTITKGTTTTCTVNTGFTYSGTMTSIAYWANGISATADANGTSQSVYVDRLTSTAVTVTGTAAGVVIHISGMLRTSTAGTLTPQVAFSAAPGGTNTVNPNTYFEITAIGADTITSVGAWQ